jgi:Tol biopolymer transport system component
MNPFPLRPRVTSVRQATMVVKKLLVLVTPLVVIALISALPAGAKVPGTNGQIVFSRQNPEEMNTDVFISNPDGTNVQQVPIPVNVEQLGGAVWSPDGSKLLITSLFRQDASGEFLPFRPATIAPDGSGFTLLDPPGAPFDMFCDAWSPSGTRILCGFGGDAPGVFSIRASDGGDPTRLSTNPFGLNDQAGDYSPDGTKIVFVRTKPGAGPNPDRTQKGALFVADSDDGGGLRQLTPYGLADSHEFGWSARWSPDGSQIVFASSRGSLFLVHADGTGLRAIPLHTGGPSVAFAPGWSPDGSRVIFSLFTATSGQEDIYTAKVDGTDLSQVTNTPDFENFADWGSHALAG